MRYPPAVALLSLVLGQPLAAQLKSAPVYPLVGARPGWAVALDVGSGLNDASGHARHVGVRMGGGIGRLQLSAAAGAWDAGASTRPQVGAAALLRLFGSPSQGLALHGLAGAGYTRAGPADTATTYWTFPVALAVVHSGLHTSLGAFRPWLAPRFEVSRVSFTPVRASQTGVGVSGGIAAGLRGRIGVHLALDWLRTRERSGVGIALPGGDRVTAGAGVHLLLSGTP